jgi:hypothetical protein
LTALSNPSRPRPLTNNPVRRSNIVVNKAPDMLQAEQIEELILLISAMDRPTLIGQLTHYRADFPLDFTPQFLNEVELDRLRHIFLALCLHHQHTPELTSSNAA